MTAHNHYFVVGIVEATLGLNVVDTSNSFPSSRSGLSLSLRVKKAKQRLFSKYEQRLRALDDSTKLVEEPLARLHSLQQGVGTAWMKAVPTQPTWELSNAPVRAALRFMLGVDPTNHTLAVHDATPSSGLCTTIKYEVQCSSELQWQLAIQRALSPKSSTCKTCGMGIQVLGSG